MTANKHLKKPVRIILTSFINYFLALKKYIAPKIPNQTIEKISDINVLVLKVNKTNTKTKKIIVITLLTGYNGIGKIFSLLFGLFFRYR